MYSMKQNIKQPYEIIQIDKCTGKMKTPSLLLMNRSFHTIGKINCFDNWNISLVANGADEISFDVHKYCSGNLCSVWDALIDLKIVEVIGFGRFEISVDYTDNTETVKSIHGISLETELAQIGLYNFHVNDEEAADMVKTEYSQDNYDSDGNFIPTTFYREIFENDTADQAEFKRKHSLLHRVLDDNAPHWSIGYVTPYIALDEKSQPEEAARFQRTYTVDGESIYDFLTGTVAEESNVVFVFDTINRLINCYSLCDCINQTTGELEIDRYKNKVTGIGCDTSVFVSKNRLANEISISSNKDNVKNCFRIEGGDDVMTAMVRAANMNGSNSIYQFAKFQYDDMSEDLRKKLEAYQTMMSSEDTQKAYYGYGDIETFLNGNLTLKVNSREEAASVLSLCHEHNIDTNAVSSDAYCNYQYWHIITNENTKQLLLSDSPKSSNPIPVSKAIAAMGIYPKLCMAYDDLLYYESSMMPNTGNGTEPGKAEEQYNKLVKTLTDPNFKIAVSSFSNYNNNLFVGITNNVETYAQAFLDSRFDLSVVKGSASYNSSARQWKGKIQIVQHTNENNIYPADVSSVHPITIKVTEDEEAFAVQKIQKALSKGSMLDIDFDISEIWENKNLTEEEKLQKIRNYFDKYSLNRLKSFYDGYESCISILMNLKYTADSDSRDSIYHRYYQQMRIISNPGSNGISNSKSNTVNGSNRSLLQEREDQIANIKQNIADLKAEQKLFQLGGKSAYSGITYEPHDFRTYIGEDFYLEFCRYRREDTYKNDNYISDGLSTAECLAKAKELIETAGKEIKKACVLQRTVSASLNNLFALPEFEPLYESFALFNYIRVQTEDEILKLRLIGIHFSGDSTAEIDVTFSEQIESTDETVNDLQNIIQQAASMSTSYPSTVLQAKQGADARQEIQDMHRSGLNTSKTMLTNNDSNEITITPSGILCKRMDDEGFYGDKQLRITGNIMAFTDDNWESVKMAVGETVFDDPTDPTGETKIPAYGIIADNIVGKFIASEKAYIGNQDGSVQITKEGIDITNGSIALSNGTYSIELDPNHRLSNYMTDKISDSTKDNFLFCIRKSAPDTIIMGVDTDGNGYFSGNITASDIAGGTIEGTNINGGTIQGTNINGGTIEGVSITGGTIEGVSITGGEILSQNNGGYQTKIEAGRIYSTSFALTEPNTTDGGLVPNVCKLNKAQTAVTNSMILFDDETLIDKPLYITNGAGGTSLVYPKVALHTWGRIYSCGAVCPDDDTEHPCGLSNYRWSTVYAKNGSINTSDRNQKHDIQTIAEVYEKLFFCLKPVNFMFNNGDRVHIGIIAQDLKESMDALELSDTEVAAFCRDEKIKTKKDETTGEAIEVPDLDENGNPQYNYGVRYSEFIMLNTYMIQKLYKEKEEMQKEIDSLKESVAFLLDKTKTTNSMS